MSGSQELAAASQGEYHPLMNGAPSSFAIIQKRFKKHEANNVDARMQLEVHVHQVRERKDII